MSGVTKLELAFGAVFLFTAALGFLNAPYLSPTDGVIFLAMGAVLFVGNRLV